MPYGQFFLPSSNSASNDNFLEPQSQLYLDKFLEVSILFSEALAEDKKIGLSERLRYAEQIFPLNGFFGFIATAYIYQISRQYCLPSDENVVINSAKLTLTNLDLALSEYLQHPECLDNLRMGHEIQKQLELEQEMPLIMWLYDMTKFDESMLTNLDEKRRFLKRLQQEHQSIKPQELQIYCKQLLELDISCALLQSHGADNVDELGNKLQEILKNDLERTVGIFSNIQTVLIQYGITTNRYKEKERPIIFRETTHFYLRSFLSAENIPYEIAVYKNIHTQIASSRNTYILNANNSSQEETMEDNQSSNKNLKRTKEEDNNNDSMQIEKGNSNSFANPELRRRVGKIRRTIARRLSGQDSNNNNNNGSNDNNSTSLMDLEETDQNTKKHRTLGLLN